MHGFRDIKYAADAAQALKPLAGQYAYILFAVGLFNASLFAASILPLSTAYTVCEGLGFESGVDKKFSEAPFFYWLYTLLIVAGGAVLLIPGLPLVKIAVLSQVVNGVVLPFVLIFMLLLINKKELMGEYVNTHLFNADSLGDDHVMVAGLSIALVLDLHRRKSRGLGRLNERFSRQNFPQPDPSPAMHPLQENRKMADPSELTTADRGRCDSRFRHRTRAR